MRPHFKFVIVCFIIGFAFIKFLGWDPLEEQRETAHWLKMEATVLSSEVSLAGNSSEYNLGIRLRATMNGNIYSYSCIRNSGPKDSMDQLAETTYAPGAPINVLINPDRLSEFSFPKRSIGPYLTGFLPGIVFILTGWILLRKIKQSRKED